MRRFSIELPLEDKYYDRASMFLNNTRLGNMEKRKDFALLKSNNHYFLFCHGADNGGLEFMHGFYSREAVLKTLIPFMEKQGIYNVYLLCCHAGTAKTVTINGRSLIPFSCTKEEIKAMMTFDGMEITFELTDSEIEEEVPLDGFTYYG